MNILITGGAGYIGSMLVRKLYESDLDFNKITVFDNLMYKQVSLASYCHRNDFEIIKGDVRKEEEFLPLLKEADVIVPLAAYVGFPACDRYHNEATQVNLGQIEFILNNTSKDQKIVYPNTDSAYGKTPGADLCTEETPLCPTSHYGRLKTDGEKAILDAGHGVVLRLATVFGVSPRMRLDLLINDFTYKAVNDGYIVLFESSFQRNFIHVQDVANAFVFAIDNYKSMEGDVFNTGLTSGNMSKMELCEKIKGYIPKFIIHQEEFATDPDERNYIVSNAKLEGLGWECEFTVDDGIRELIKAYKMITHDNNRKYTNL